MGYLTESDIFQLVAAWLHFHQTTSAEKLAKHNDWAPENDPDWWAVSALMDLVDSDVETAWKVVTLLCKEAEGALEYANIGAGPLEDLLHGEPLRSLQYLDEMVEDNPMAINAVACVWIGDPSIRKHLDFLLEKYEHLRR